MDEIKKEIERREGCIEQHMKINAMENTMKKLEHAIDEMEKKIIDIDLSLNTIKLQLKIVTFVGSALTLSIIAYIMKIMLS